MRLTPAHRLAVSTAVLALGLALVPANSAFAAPSWKVGSCYTGAEIQNDLLVTTTAVACDQPHTVQVVGGAALPASFAGFSLTQLRDQSNTSLRKALGDFGDQACNGRLTAPGIWPVQGAAIASALTGSAATTAGGVLPGYNKGMNFGWVFPDAAAFDAGDRSMVCVVYVAQPKSDGSVAVPNGMRGNLQDLGTKAVLPAMRDCSIYVAKTQKNVAVPCDKPHVDELVVHYAGRLPVDLDKMTDAQWVPFDAQCRALAEVLIGAKRKDLRIYADPAVGAKANASIYLPCFVSLPKAADGTHRKLPGGTVVGLGTQPLKAA